MLRSFARIRDTEERLASTAEYDDHGLVFATRRGTPIAPWNLLRQFKQLRKEAGLPEITFHDLRHTHATMMLAASIAPKIIAERHRHTGSRRPWTSTRTFSRTCRRRQRSSLQPSSGCPRTVARDLKVPNQYPIGHFSTTFQKQLNPRIPYGAGVQRVGGTGLEPVTSCMSSMRSSHLS